MIRRLLRLAYLILQHPMHLHRALVRRGLALKWLDNFRPFWDQVRPPSLPISDYASYTWLEYYFSARLREKYPQGDHFDDMDAQYARLLSYVKRREMHPLRMLKVAWHLRKCTEVLEYGAGAAPYAHFIRTAWPWYQRVIGFDLPSLLAQYAGSVTNAQHVWQHQWDGIVCTEVFEHLKHPIDTAHCMMEAASLICFDYVDDGNPTKGLLRPIVLSAFHDAGRLIGPDARGLYVWRRH